MIELLRSELDTVHACQKDSLINQLSALRFLLQGIPIRNNHTGGSNFTIILQHVLGELAWVDDYKYQSPEIINEMIQVMGYKVLC